MKRIRSRNAAAPVGPYPHACKAGNFLFLSGIGPRPADGGPVAGTVFDANSDILDYDIDQQCHAVFRNVRAVLESANCTLGDLVDITVYLTDMRRDFASFNRIYAEYFTDDGPCRTTVEVTRLPTPIAIEVKCIAYAPSTPSNEN